MIWMLAVLVVIITIGGISSRLDERGRRQAWLGSLLMTAIGGIFLAAAEITGDFGFFYLSAVMLAVGLPLSLLLTAAAYLRRDSADDVQVVPGRRNRLRP